MVFDYMKPDRVVVLLCTGKSEIKTLIIPEIFLKLPDWAYSSLDRHFVNISWVLLEKFFTWADSDRQGAIPHYEIIDGALCLQ